MRVKYKIFAPVLVLLSACSHTPDYDATGIFECTTVTVSAETSGKLTYFPVLEGDSVVAGELIASVDTALLTLQQKQLESQKVSALTGVPDISAQAAALRAQIVHQKHEVDRQKNLLDDGATTQKQYDDASAALKVTEAQLQALISTLTKNSESIADNGTALQYQKEQVGQQIARSSIVAPITGTVLTKYAEPGEFAMPGKPLVELADLNKIYLRSYFTANQLANLRIGQKVTVIADFGCEEQYEYPGKVLWISQQSQFTPKSIQTRDSRANLVYAVKIGVKNDGRLKLGQYGQVKL